MRNKMWRRSNSEVNDEDDGEFVLHMGADLISIFCLDLTPEADFRSWQKLRSATVVLSFQYQIHILNINRYVGLHIPFHLQF